MPHNRRNYNKTHSIALSGLLFALAMALSFIEGTLVIPGLLPGMKLGLANIVVMYALFFMGPKQALVLDVLKAFFVFLVSGWTAGFLSLCGGLLSLLVMWLLYYHCPLRPTWFILSVCGALATNSPDGGHNSTANRREDCPHCACCRDDGIDAGDNRPGDKTNGTDDANKRQCATDNEADG